MPGYCPSATLALFSYTGDYRHVTVASLLQTVRDWPHLQVEEHISDPLITRARSVMASRFLADPSWGDVLLMVDADIGWERFDLQRLAAACAETKGVVGGVYAKRYFGQGWAVRLLEPGEYKIGEDRLVSAEVGTGFIAIHRDVLAALVGRVPYAPDVGVHFFFFQDIRENIHTGMREHQGEDYAFCIEARAAGFPVLAYLAPALVHDGRYTYRAQDGSLHVPPDATTVLIVEKLDRKAELVEV